MSRLINIHSKVFFIFLTGIISFYFSIWKKIMIIKVIKFFVNENFIKNIKKNIITYTKRINNDAYLYRLLYNNLHFL